MRLRLTGERATDVADASGTLLFDVAERRWSDEVLEALELPTEWLPTALESPRSPAERPNGTPVAAGAGDQAAGALGVGVAGPGPLSVVLGTSGVVFAALPAYAPEPEARLHVFCHAVPGTWHAMGVMLSAAGSLRWFRDAFAPDVAYDELLAEAEDVEPGAEGVLFLPYLSGERTPHADPHARAAFIGLGLEHDRAALTRAVLEGVAYGLRDSLELLRQLGVRAGEWARLGRRRPQPALAARSSPRRSGSRWSSRSPRKAPPSARPCSARSLRVRSRTSTRRSRHASGPASGSSPTQAGCARTRPVTLASARCIRPSNTWRSDDTGGEGRAGHRARAAGSAARSRRCWRPPASASGWRPAAATTSGSKTWSRVRATCATRPTSRQIVGETVDRFGRLDILVANAGVGAYGPFLELSPEHLEEMIDVNVKGTLYAVRAALPHLLESGEADLVTIASEAGRRGLPLEAVYCASKFAQVGFTRAMDHELRERGVRCTNICPGGVATDFAMGRGRTPEMPELAG